MPIPTGPVQNSFEFGYIETSHAHYANHKNRVNLYSQSCELAQPNWQRPYEMANVFFTMNENGIPIAVERDSTDCEQGGLFDAHHIYGEAE